MSLGTEVAIAVAANDNEPARLVLVAPIAEAYPMRWRWLEVDRRLEWLLQHGFVDGDGSVRLDEVAGDVVGRSGWWDSFAVNDFPTAVIAVEEVQAILLQRHEAEKEQAIAHGNTDAPASFWRDWCSQEPAFRRIRAVHGRMALHVGADDWTTPPQQAMLLSRSAPPSLRTSLTVYPGLGHLMSPRNGDGRRTYGPFTAQVLAAIAHDGGGGGQ